MGGPHPPSILELAVLTSTFISLGRMLFWPIFGGWILVTHAVTHMVMRWILASGAKLWGGPLLIMVGR